MPYLQRVVKAGAVVEIKKYYAARVGSFERSGRMGTTSDAAREVHRRDAVERLRWLLNANFRSGDYHLTLTYSSECSPPNPDVAKAELARWLRAARKIYSAAGVEFKYINVTEFEAKRIHHHVICSRADAEALAKAWQGVPGHGRVRITLLYGSDFSKLAEYLIKETERTFRKPAGETASRKRWNASRNLIKPDIEKRSSSAAGGDANRPSGGGITLTKRAFTTAWTMRREERCSFTG